MEREELNRFAEALMQRVRDPAIDAADLLADGRIKGPTGNRWAQVVTSDEVRRAVKTVLPDIVDGVLFELLDAIDHNGLRLAWESSDGSWLPLEDLGGAGMGGWFATEDDDGWRARFSERRTLDDAKPDGSTQDQV